MGAGELADEIDHVGTGRKTARVRVDACLAPSFPIIGEVQLEVGWVDAN